MELRDVGEFGLIALIDNGIYAPDAIVQGIGDDCAVLPYDDKHYQLLSCDMLNENVHFLLDKITPYQLGYKAIAVNLSDIAAMGGWATNIVISIGLTDRVTVSWWQEFYRGVADICRRYQVNIAGGDTTKSQGGVTINVTVLGLVEKENLHLRSQAQTGDKIFVTGPLGASRAGLELIWQPQYAFAGDDILRQAHLQPEPCCQESRWLNIACGAHLHALNDISDGLISECREIAAASGKGAILDEQALPILTATRQLADKCEQSATEWALSGGEDYQLVGTLDAGFAQEALQHYQTLSGKPFYIIGEIIQTSDVFLRTSEGLKVVQAKGYAHF